MAASLCVFTATILRSLNDKENYSFFLSSALLSAYLMMDDFFLFHEALAFSFLSLSVVIDSILDPWLWWLGECEFFLEDGFKWLGIVFWCSYYFDTSLAFIMRLISIPNKQG